MKKCAVISFLLCAVLSACSCAPTKLVGIVFERGHGSAWGNQFYINVCKNEIAATRYIPEGAADQTVREHIPITAEQWQTLANAIEKLELKKERGSWIKALLGKSKLDGGEYRNLSLIWETGAGTVETKYTWPQNEQAQALESLLEQLAKTA